ncbi:hypothetical protein [Paenibacillus sp. GP183]|uniref:hypothetical protein n=1 Tax=Paenibacillus sp. GP183 TaxID=1882751 RepID=UPI00089CA800|nr:hypothetical protein [Paenibacillus sp. GP183]SEC02460.1 hypothetical protein SAMN05443246_2709 [Paenibacillus sp. GP183]
MKRIISVLLTLILTFPLLTIKQNAYAQCLKTHWAKKENGFKHQLSLLIMQKA